MTENDYRLECLKLAIPKDLANPDVNKIIERAKAFEAYVKGDGYATAPSDSPKRQARKTGQGDVTPPAIS